MSATALTQLPTISRRRRLTDKAMRGLLFLLTGVALVPLVLVLFFLFQKGLPAWSGSFFTTDPNGNFLGYPGGVRSAILGTIEIVALTGPVRSRPPPGGPPQPAGAVLPGCCASSPGPHTAARPC